MIFEIVGSKVGMSRWHDAETSVAITFDVVPAGHAYLEIGDDYLLPGPHHFYAKDENKKVVEASLQITSNTSSVAHIKSDKPVIGYAAFSPGRDRDFETVAPKLYMIVVVEPARFSELLALGIKSSGETKLHVSIDDLEYGWEPDGCHQIWKLSGDQPTALNEKRPIESFWISVDTMNGSATSVKTLPTPKAESALSGEPDYRAQLAKQAEAQTRLLEHIRLILGLIALLLVTSYFRNL